MSARKEPRGESSTKEQRPEGAAAERLALLHRRFGWTSLFAWMCLGLVLELAHGFKLGGYLLDPLRREFLTLAHFHGALLSVLNLVYVRWAEAPSLGATQRLHASRALVAGTVLMPLGFLLGGIQHYEGDPGLGIFLAPIGALALLYCVLIQLRAAWKPER
ncbi:MAG: hypothetical protein HOP12_03540 [Candidatus Eisenbacteria bacterium]|uniref:Cbb3-type cytochrome c oxidase subunit I n=1 Tax=Eiseniibacteriota bacterium TaxID=2212470 RepID=A0A849SKX6_UNCEI|nr:hypothetical protein [Candidatus Eisenbacteria bacterium]